MHVKVNTFHAAVNTWARTTIGQLMFLNPNHGFNLVLLNNVANNADLQTYH